MRSYGEKIGDSPVVIEVPVLGIAVEEIIDQQRKDNALKAGSLNDPAKIIVLFVWLLKHKVTESSGKLIIVQHQLGDLTILSLGQDPCNDTEPTPLALLILGLLRVSFLSQMFIFSTWPTSRDRIHKTARETSNHRCFI